MIEASKNILEFHNITKSFLGTPALQEITLSVPEGSILGLVGENGAGKSTLMNVLGGVVKPDQGIMKLNDKDYCPKNPSDATRLGIGFIHQELNLFANLSVADNIFIDHFPKISLIQLIDKRKLRKKTSELLKAVNLNISPDVLVGRLSPGHRQLVEIAKGLAAGASIFIFDEPTTSLTESETECLFELIFQLKSEGKTIIYISHILNDILKLADTIAVLKDGKLVRHDNAALLTVKDMISLMTGRKLEQLYPHCNNSVSDEVILEVCSLSQPGIVKDIHLKLYKGQIHGLFGLMGSGRTELARMIFGLDDYSHGQIFLEGVELKYFTPRKAIRKKMAFITENRREDGLLLEAEISTNMSLVALPWYCKARPMNIIKASELSRDLNKTAHLLGIKCASIGKTLVKNLSGGNQQKVIFGKWLIKSPSVFILDEPTKGIDVGSKFEIYNIISNLAKQGTGVLYISSELEELMGICNRITVMAAGRMRGSFDRTEFDKKQILHFAFDDSSLEIA